MRYHFGLAVGHTYTHRQHSSVVDLTSTLQAQADGEEGPLGISGSGTLGGGMEDGGLNGNYSSGPRDDEWQDEEDMEEEEEEGIDKDKNQTTNEGEDKDEDKDDQDRDGEDEDEGDGEDEGEGDGEDEGDGEGEDNPSDEEEFLAMHEMYGHG